MRRISLFAAAASLVLLFSAQAGAQTRGNQIEGFGGMTFGTTTSSAPTAGGSVAVPIGEHLQIIGEAGRLADVKSSLLDSVLDFTPVDVRLSAWYGEGGLRFIASPRSAVRPYAEATAGVARLTTGVRGGGELGAIANTALGFLGSTEPILGAGAGVILQGGPLFVDLGYRYKRIAAGNSLASALTLGGNAIEVNQLRVGFGVRF
jgi:opacity protein-like surface antigen